MRRLHFIILFICLFLNVLTAIDIPIEHKSVMNSALLEVFNVDQPESIERLLKGL